MKPLLILFIVLFAAKLQAQDINIDELSLEDLINIKTSVASKTSKSMRESAGIVSVITKEEISKMGARDLIDVLQMVPGIQFAHDVQGQVGLAMRGNWAHEGKFSLMVDGQEMNEILYSTVSFGNHYPVDHIKRIEIIRGPGSAIYGGYAELAVIHIITEKGEDINGAKAVATYGQMREDYGRRNLSAQLGKKIGDWDYSIAGLIGEGRRGDGSYTGYKSNAPPAVPPPNYLSETYDYSKGDANNLNPGWMNLGASNGKWDIRLIYDNYRTTSRALYNYSNGLQNGIKTSFESLYASVKYDFKIGDTLTLTPYFNLRHQKPWNVTDSASLTVSGNSIFDITARRTRAGLSSQYQLTTNANLLIGAEAYKDEAEINTYITTLGAQTFSMTGNNKVDFDGLAAYSQLELDLDWFDVTVGGRWEHLVTPVGNSISKVVPRFALTRANEKRHFKLLASQAYRTPSIFNFDANPNIQPETTTTYELEYGWALSKISYFTVNLFATEIEDAIIYTTDGTNDFYTNEKEIQTQGFEMEYKKKSKFGFTNINYSFYQRGNNSADTYTVPGRKEFVGIPQHKLTYMSSMKTGVKNLIFTPSIIYMRAKYSYELDVANDTEVLRQLPSITLVNLYFTYSDFWIDGLVLGAGVFNVFDEENRFVQPYNGELGNAPAPSREFLARLTYSINF
ncbi:TonB-dependent receptor plug domain-containing protein [bacterium]|nr:TonB-dependent receptor plug domain-containing protein [bacterium]